MKCILYLLIAFLLAACSSDLYRRIYEGIVSNNDAKKTPIERAASPAPSYDKYKKEREELPKE